MCKSCGGRGKETRPNGPEQCGICDGAGTIYPDESITRILNIDTTPRMAERIINLPNLLVSSGGTDTHLFFLSNHLRGLIMGLDT